MTIFVAGATGAIGRPLTALLIAKGHHVVAMTHTAAKAEALRSIGAEPVVLSGLDRDAVVRAVIASRPAAIVHEMTALASTHSLRKFDDEFALTNRLRTEGTEHLIAAAEAAGTRRLVVQSYTGWPSSREGGRIKTENDPFERHLPKAMTRSLAAIRRLEDIAIDTTSVSGTVLRYGNLYGPATAISPEGEIVQMVRQRKFPVLGDGAGVWSFIHVDDAAHATLLAIEREALGIYNIVDDEPAEVSVWLPELARAIGAKPPRHLPAWLGRLAMGEPGLWMMTKVRGSSNARAKRELGWQPELASWRQGFRNFQ